MEFPTRADAQSSSTGIDKVVGVYCTGKQAANYEVRILDEKLKALVSCGSTSFTFEKYYNMQPSGSERRVSVIYIRLPYAEMVESTTYYIKPSIDLFCEAYPKAEIRIDYDATNQHFLYGCDGT